MTTTENVSEKILASTIITSSLAKSSPMIDSYVGWLMGGYAAAFGLTIASLESLSSQLPTSAIRTILYGFAVLTVLAIIEKLLAVVVQAFAAGAAVGKDIGAVADVDFNVVFSEIESSFGWPAKSMMRRSFEAAKRGDLTLPARRAALLAKLQGTFAGLIVGVVLIVTFVVAMTARV